MRDEPVQSKIVFSEKSEISEFLLVKWKEISVRAIKKKRYFAVALSGGKTPIDFYIKLAGVKDKLNWENTHIFLADERYVPAVHPDSNYRLLYDTFLNKVPVPLENIHLVPYIPGDSERSALRYEKEIKHFFLVKQNEIPAFDLILLGIGTDGHTASLFSGDKAVKEISDLCSSVRLDEKRHDRITMTMPLINRAENIIMLATGANKAEIVKRVVEDKDSSLPAALVKPENGRLIYLLDIAAASKLTK